MNATSQQVADRDAAAVALGLTVGIGLFLATSIATSCCVLLTNRRRQLQARANSRPHRRKQVTASHSNEFQAVNTENALLSDALKALQNARKKARRLRTTLNVVAFALAFLVIFIAMPLIGVLIAAGQPFWPAGIAFALLAPFAAGLKADPMMPRQSRMDMGSSATFMFPLMCGFLWYFAVYTARAPRLYGICSVDDPTCAQAAWIFVALWAALGLAQTAWCFYLLPTLFVTRDQVVPPVKALLEEQRQVILAEPAFLHPAMFRTNPIYLLAGADTGYFDENVRLGIQRFTKGFPVLAFATGLPMIAAAIALDRTGVVPQALTMGGLLPTGITIAVWWSLGIHYEPAVRSVFEILVLKGEARRAAVLAGLTGSYSPSKVLSVARASFRAIPADAISAADFVNDAPHEQHGKGLADAFEAPGPTVRTGLAARTVGASLGDVDGFICHSWHDDAKRQFDALSRWVTTFREENDGTLPVCWFDRACVDIANVGQSLACLPVYLSGCKQLIMLAGPTFTERLWCAMEVFVFVSMGGAVERVRCLPLDGDAGVRQQFERFNVRQTKCAKEEDKQRLLSAIESAFHATDNFDQLVRSLLTGALTNATRT